MSDCSISDDFLICVMCGFRTKHIGEFVQHNWKHIPHLGDNID